MNSVTRSSSAKGDTWTCPPALTGRSLWNTSPNESDRTQLIEQFFTDWPSIQLTDPRFHVTPRPAAAEADHLSQQLLTDKEADLSLIADRRGSTPIEARWCVSTAAEL